MKRRILIVKIGAIGDVIMAIEAFSFFQKEKVTWVVGKNAASLVEKIEGIEKLIIVDEEKLFSGSFWSLCKELFKVQRKLFFSFFDTTFLLHRDWRYRIFSLLTFSRKKLYLCSQRTPGLYHAEEYRRLFAKRMVVKPFSLAPFFPRLAREERAVILAPGGAKNVLQESPLRRWPIAHYVNLAKKLNEEKIKVILIGSDSDRWVLDHFQGIAYENLLSFFSLPELIGFLKNRFILVSHDSSFLHLAKIAKSPMIALFGPTDPSEFCGKQDHIHFFWGGKDLACRPCYNGKSYPPCPYPRCLASISEEVVFQKILELWDDL